MMDSAFVSERLKNDVPGVVWFVLRVSIFVCAFLNAGMPSTHVALGTAVMSLGAGMLVMGIVGQVQSKRPNSKVALTKGVYKTCRHPQYAGMVFLCLGLALMRGSECEKTLFWTFPLMLILEKLADRDEDLLCTCGGEPSAEYLAYRVRTPKILPGIGFIYDVFSGEWLSDSGDVNPSAATVDGHESMSMWERFFSWVVFAAAFPLFINAMRGANMFAVWPAVFYVLFFSGFYFLLFGIFDLGVNFSVLTKLSRHHQIVQDGVFSWCRHPQYLGMILISMGMTAYWHHQVKATNGLFWTTVFMLIVQKQIDREEAALFEEFGNDADYRKYLAETPGLIPWVSLPFAELDTAALWLQNIYSAVLADISRLCYAIFVACCGEPHSQSEEPLLTDNDSKDNGPLTAQMMAQNSASPDVWFDGKDPSALPAALCFLKPWALSEVSRLPKWAYDSKAKFSRDEVKKHFFELQKRFCGPGIYWAWRAIVNNYLLFMIVPVLARFRSSCDPAGGFAICDDLPLFVLFFFSWLCAMTCQVKCIRSVILLQLGMTDKFKLDLLVAKLNFNRFPFKFWLGVYLILSTFNLLDTFSNAELLGRVWATRSCPAYHTMNDIWSEVMAQALISKVFFFTKFDLANEFVFLYGLIVIQLVFAIYACVPIEEDVFYDTVDEEESSRKTEYETIYFQRNKVDHGAVLQILAETARLEGVIFQDSKCTWKAVEQYMADWRDSKSLQLELEILKKIHAKVARLAVRFFLVAVLQNALQVNVQISMMAVSRVVTGSVDVQLLFSVVMGLIGVAMDFPDMCEAGKLVWKLMKGYWNMLAMYPDKERHSSGSEEKKLASRCKEQLWKCNFIFARYFMYMMVYLILLVFTLVKLVAFFWCDSHLMNGTGCAQLNTTSSATNVSHAD